jgi:hypothetical protein
MAGSRLGFDRNQIQLHQVLGVKLTDAGVSGMPLRPDWEVSAAVAQSNGTRITPGRDTALT